MTTVTVIQGLPASGKTTYARSLDPAMRLSLDDYRAMCGIGKETWTSERELAAIAAMIESARAMIVAGHDVALDNTHVVPRLPSLYRKEFSQLGVTFKVHSFMDVTVEECVKRDAERESGVGEEVIRSMAERYVGAGKSGWKLTDSWMNSARYVPPKPYGPQPDLPECVIVDIDGTVALNDGHRGPFDWSKVDGDSPNWPVIDLVRDLDDLNEVIFFSGRDDSCRDATVMWMQEFGLPTKHLYMRTTNDNRPDYIIKEELFDRHVRGVYDVRFVIDDRNQVVRLYRAMGIACLQCNEGDF